MGELLQNYLNKQPIHTPLIADKPEEDLQLVIIIPAFNEPDLIKTLASIKSCKPGKYPSEVIILINHSEASPTTVKEFNQKTYHEIQDWVKLESNAWLKFHCILKGDFPQKHAGVGLARKTLMDEACRRFAMNNNEQGIIASCDADSLVSTNYISDIQDEFISNRKLNCTIFGFEHQLTSNLSIENREAILLYEMYLRYFKLELLNTGFPYAFHTIGSCFAVRASVYAKQGGMSKRQAGEDFYFLHKIFPLGNCREINKITVYPSSRPSNRVPFGTGNAVQKILENHDFLTYNPIFFTHLKVLFNNVNKLYNANTDIITAIYQTLHSSIQDFINLDEFLKRIKEVNSNCASEEKFVHRFFQWFDAFKVIKYLNFAHIESPRLSIKDAVGYFLATDHKTIQPNEYLEILNKLKEMELENSNY